MKKILFMDSTLCEGERSPSCSMNLNEKIELAKQLERLGVDIIDAGYPISSPDDFEVVEKICQNIQTTTICACARCVENDIRRAWDAVKTARLPRLKLSLNISDSGLKSQFLSREEAIETTASMVKYACGFCSNVEFSASDAIQTDKSFLIHILDTAAAAGATTLCLVDNEGYAMPGEISELVSYVKQNLQNQNIIISIHCRNDLGLGVANTLEAIQAGATQVVCTINGIGERAGNASLEEIAMAISSRTDFYQRDISIQTKEIYRSSKLLSTITGIQVSPYKPIVGLHSLSNKSQQGTVGARSDSAISPEKIGRFQNNIILEKNTDQHSFVQRIQEMGYLLNPEECEDAYRSFQLLSERKREVDDRDLEALLMGAASSFKEIYRLKSYVINCGTIISSTAVVSLIKEGGEIIENVARGDGPIDAAFKAIDQIVKMTSTLKNWTMQAVTEGEDALGEAVSKIICNGKLVTGRGLSTDILEASILSYLNAINKALAFTAV